jgi:hypothetical protein
MDCAIQGDEVADIFVSDERRERGAKRLSEQT